MSSTSLPDQPDLIMEDWFDFDLSTNDETNEPRRVDAMPSPDSCYQSDHSPDDLGPDTTQTPPNTLSHRADENSNYPNAVDTSPSLHSCNQNYTIAGDAGPDITQTSLGEVEGGALAQDAEPGATVEDEGDAASEPRTYEFRPYREPKTNFITTWMDLDQTGDFDPSEDRRQERNRRIQRKLRCQERASKAKEASDEDEALHQVEVIEIPRLEVILSVRSKAGRAKFEQIIKDSCANTENELNSWNGYRFRKRKRTATCDSSGDSGLPPDLLADLTGHPRARGCWECANLGHDCSLLENEFMWPCATCTADGNECHLIEPPVRKRACERCKRRKFGCSYNHTLNHGNACRQCRKDGYTCLAGPAKEAIRARIRYDRDWINDPLPVTKAPKVRKHLPCMECREAGRSCSFLETGNAGQPCENCKSKGDECTLENVIQQSHTKINKDEDEKPTEAKPTEADESGAAPLPILPNRTQIIEDPIPEGITKKIGTKFSHPIWFNYEDKSKGKKPCHFCADPAYGIIGLEKKQVEVIDWKDGRGLEEVSGGHRGKGAENTRMCPTCTLIRMTIATCSAHKIKPISGLQKKAVDLNAALMDLLSGNVKKDLRWCSICPSVALYECSTPCDGSHGCGLKLCEHCMVVLSDTHHGNLQRMLANLKDEPTSEKILGLRADFDLLKVDGLLMRYILYSTQR